VDTSNVGLDVVHVYVIHDGIDVNHSERRLRPGLNEFAFMPGNTGIYSINIFCGGFPIPGLGGCLKKFDTLTKQFFRHYLT
jgi:hypothetical protein